MCQKHVQLLRQRPLTLIAYPHLAIQKDRYMDNILVAHRYLGNVQVMFLGVCDRHYIPKSRKCG